MDMRRNPCPYQNIRYLVYISRKYAANLQHVSAYICGAFAANAFFVCKLLFWRTVLTHNVRRKYAVHSCRALFWHTMCATSLQRTVAAHCTGTQCAPQVCGAQLSRTILAHNVRRTGKFAAHSCRALYWHTMCAASMQRTVVAHYSGTQCAPYR